MTAFLWSLAALVFVLAATPLIVWAVLARNPRRFGVTRRNGGGSMMLAALLVFGSIFDPAQRSLIEASDTNKTHPDESGDPQADPD